MASEAPVSCPLCSGVYRSESGRVHRRSDLVTGEPPPRRSDKISLSGRSHQQWASGTAVSSSERWLCIRTGLLGVPGTVWQHQRWCHGFNRFGFSLLPREVVPLSFLAWSLAYSASYTFKALTSFRPVPIVLAGASLANLAFQASSLII